MTKEDQIEVLRGYRDRIDDIDRRIVSLLNERTRVVEQLGRVKEELELPVYEPKREDQVYANIVSANDGPLPPEALKRLFERIVDEMRSLQHMNRRNRKKNEEAAED